MKKILLAVVASLVLGGCATSDGKDPIPYHPDHRQAPASEPMVKQEPLKAEQMAEKKCTKDCLAYKKNVNKNVKKGMKKAKKGVKKVKQNTKPKAKEAKKEIKQEIINQKK